MLGVFREGRQIGESRREAIYISEKLSGVLLGSELLIDLKIIYPTFPFSANVNIKQVDDTVRAATSECGCPLRTNAPLPPALPCEPTEENVQFLKEFIMKHYESSSFNTCSHQPLPLVHGPPIHFKVNPKIKPTTVRVPATVPLHIEDKVKRGLDNDIKLGVLEKVPEDTGETWTTRMHVVRKHNGDPRRVVDFQELNKACV